MQSQLRPIITPPLVLCVRQGARRLSRVRVGPKDLPPTSVRGPHLGDPSGCVLLPHDPPPVQEALLSQHRPLHWPRCARLLDHTQGLLRGRKVVQMVRNRRPERAEFPKQARKD